MGRIGLLDPVIRHAAWFFVECVAPV